MSGTFGESTRTVDLKGDKLWMTTLTSSMTRLGILSPIPDHKLQVFIDIVNSYAKLSKDPRTKVASLILRRDFSIISGGYNGFPAGFPDSEEYWNDRERKNAMVIHSEENAIDYAGSNDLTGSILICTHYPCPRCAAKIVKRRIAYVYYLNDKRADHNCSLTDDIFRKANVHTFRC